MTRVKNTSRQSMTPASLAVLLATALLLTPVVQANSVGTVPLVDQGNQALRKCGAARLKVLFWDIYESSLYTPDGTWSEGVRPLRLDIRYLRAISALDLVKQTGKEWAEQGKSSPQHLVWQGELLSIWPDVTEGDVISLAIDASGVSTFLFNGDAIGTIGDPEFGEDFAGIWLSPDTTRPTLRRQLIGEADA